MSYAWNAEEGHFGGETTGNPTDWRAPDEAGDYQIKCTVNDGQSAVSKMVVVEVRQDG